MPADPPHRRGASPSAHAEARRASAVLVVLGGVDPVDESRLFDAVDEKTVVVAADSGLGAALAAGIDVHHVVGDLDSAEPSWLAAAIAAGAEVHPHPADKDATDGELAVDMAVTILTEETRPAGEDAGGLAVVGGGGGRLDHLLGDVIGLASDRLAPFPVTARFGRATVTVVRPGQERSIVGRRRELISLLVPRGPARGVTTVGLRWALEEADLAPGSTRGISNELVAAEATVRLRQGVLLAIQPGDLARDVEARESGYDPSPVLDTDGLDEPDGHRPQ